jgi:hypothetical protein
VGAVFGMAMNGARNYDMAGAGFIGAAFFGVLAWVALYFAGLA